MSTPDPKYTVEQWLKVRLRIFKQQATRLIKQKKSSAMISRSFRIDTRTLTVTGPAYANYIDKGVRGHGKGTYKTNKKKAIIGPGGSPYMFKKFGPPVDVIRRWNDKVNGDDSRQGAFLISRSIGRFGLDAAPFIDKAAASAFTNPKALKRLGDELAEDVKLIFGKNGI